MFWTSGGVANRIFVPQQTLQTWLKRFPDLIESVGGGTPGKHRIFPIKSVMQLAVVAMLRDHGFTLSLRRMMEIGKIVGEYDADVRIHDEVAVVITKDDCLIGPKGHRKFLDENFIPLSGIYYTFTCLHREFHGPHKPREPETPNERQIRLGFDPIEYLHETDHSLAWLMKRDIE